MVLAFTLPGKMIDYHFARGKSRFHSETPATKNSPLGSKNMPMAGVEPARGVNHARF